MSQFKVCLSALTVKRRQLVCIFYKTQIYIYIYLGRDNQNLIVLVLKQLRMLQKEIGEDFLIIEANMLISKALQYICSVVYDRLFSFFRTFLEDEKVPAD